VSRPPIENGGVYIRDGLIQDVGTWADLSRRWAGEPSEDLGEVALLPGLVNAHCHLDYTGMAGMIPPPSSSLNFPDWIKSILSLKAHWSYTEFAASWVKGAKQLLESGCTTVFDIEAVPELLPEAWESTPLRVMSFLEMTGVRSGHQPERILRDAEREMTRWGTHPRSNAALSPHALYSTPPELLKLVAEKMRTEKIPVSIHLAESEAEWEMYQNARGPLYDWLKSQRPMTDCGGKSPIQRAHELGLLQPSLLAIHCNYLALGDTELLAKNGVTVVHCPRSHAYFQHAPFPYEELRAAGVNVVLATDSLASIRPQKGNDVWLNMWDEMRSFWATTDVKPSDVIAMATSHDGIQIGSAADLAAISYAGEIAALPERLVERTPRVVRTFIAGA
jgi:aminodeoxyfutalosine deaminase